MTSAAIIPSASSASFYSRSFESVIRVCCTLVGKCCRKRDFSKSSVILFPTLLLLSSKRFEGFRRRSPSSIQEMRSRMCCSSESAYCKQSLVQSSVYGFSAGGFKTINPTMSNSSAWNAEIT
ncbi:hypothetical protein NPIL_140991 [Nephila pilipes]|uniref:Uncharacterized protein n=1 Tax=Nephila pilipes TaxID=299642 RepID=A0A8X6N0F0_NEPPI|nr:hypothetical protein NPIL_140991 [Nephila pilipes]